MGRIPRPGSIRDMVCRSIFKNGPMKMDQIVPRFPGIRSRIVKEAVHQMRHYGALELVEDVYHLAYHMRANYKGEPLPQPEPVVSSVTPVRAFKPWTGKYDPLNGLRREEIRRDVGFKTAGTGHIPFDYQY